MCVCVGISRAFSEKRPLGKKWSVTEVSISVGMCVCVYVGMSRTSTARGEVVGDTRPRVDYLHMPKTEHVQRPKWNTINARNETRSTP